MKLLITSLTMIFISFGANALTIEQLYKKCKPYQNNGFEFDNLSPGQIHNAVACLSYIAGLTGRGYANCLLMNEFNKIKFLDKDQIKVISNLTANKDASTEQVIASFTNYAENNTEEWKYSPFNYAFEFISKKFPCKLNK